MNYELDKIAKDTLYNHSASAPDDVWNEIKKNLNTKKKRTILPIFWKAMAASIALLISFGSGYFFNSGKQNNQQQIAKAKLNFYHKIKISGIKPIFVSTKGIRTINYSNTQFKTTSFPAEKQNNNLRNFAIINTLKIKTEPIIALLNIAKFKNINNKTSTKYTPKELLAVQNEYFTKETTKQPTKNIKKWAIGGHIAPSYSYRDMKKNTTDLPSEYYNSVEKALLTYSGGLSISLNLNKRISFESGINYAQFGQSSNLLYAQQNPLKGSAYEVATSAGVITPKPTSIERISGAYRYVDPLGNIINTEAELIQNFTYFEIPLNTKIKLVDKKVGVSLIAGFNTDILIGNKVFFKNNGDKSYIGQTENLNQVRYSSNIGFGIDYKINKTFNFKLEPEIKYALTPINKNPEINNYPYTLGVNTGIVIHF